MALVPLNSIGKYEMPQLSLAVKPEGLPQVVPPIRRTSRSTPRRLLMIDSLAEHVPE